MKSINSDQLQPSEDLATTPPAKEISRKLFFQILICNYGLCNAIMGYHTVALNPILNTIANPNNYNLNKNKEIYYSLLSSMFYVGMFLANITIGFYRNLRPRNVLTTILILYIFASFLVFIPSIEVLIVSRLLIGYFSGYMQVAASSFVYDLSPPNSKVYYQMVFSYQFAIGSLFSYLVSLSENGSWLRWRINLVIPCQLAVIHLLNQYTIYRNIDSPLYCLRNNQENNAYLALNEYTNPVVTKNVIESLKILISSENKKNSKSKGKCESISQIFVIYHKELTYAVYFGFATSFTSFSSCMAYANLILIKDPNDQDEKDFQLYLFPLYTVAEIICTWLTSMFNLHKYRKRANMVAMYGFTSAWAQLALCYWYDAFTAAKFLFLAFYILKGSFLVPSFFIISNDCFVSEILGVACGAMYLSSFVVTLVTPLLIQQASSYIYYAGGSAILTLIFAIISSFVVFETFGQEKHEIYNKFRGHRGKLPESFVNIKDQADAAGTTYKNSDAHETDICVNSIEKDISNASPQKHNSM